MINMIEYPLILIATTIFEIIFNFISRKTKKIYAAILCVVLLIVLNIQHPLDVNYFLENNVNLIIILVAMCIGLYLGDKIYPAEIKMSKS